MNYLFDQLFNWWGQWTHGTDLRQFLKGFNTLTGDYSGSARYALVGIIMIFLTSAILCLYYLVLDSDRLRKRKYWLMFLTGSSVLHFFIAFIIATAGVEAVKTQQIDVSYFDCIGFGVSVMIWSMLWFVTFSLTPYPRRWGINCRHTPLKQ